MKCYEQLNYHDPENGIWGDCGRTAIGCLIEKPPEDIPHFWDRDNKQGNIECQKWLRKQGYEYVYFAVKAETLQDALDIFGCCNRYIYYLLVGESKNGCNHVVVCKGRDIIHDPGINKPGITGPCNDGYYWIELVVKQ